MYELIHMIYLCNTFKLSIYQSFDDWTWKIYKKSSRNLVFQSLNSSFSFTLMKTVGFSIDLYL